MDVVRKGNSVIKRIGLLIVVALVAAMMMVATASPAFARAGTDKGPCRDQNGSKCQVGNNEIKVTGNGTCTTDGSARGFCRNA